MNQSPATSKRRGSSGFIRPEFYAKHKKHKGEVCSQNIGYTLAEYADNVEKMVTSGDYRLFYKHFYYADENMQLQYKTKNADDDYIIDKQKFAK